MNLTTVLIIYLVIGGLHAVIIAMGMSGRYKEVFMYTPTLVLILLSLVVATWPLFLITGFLAVWRNVRRWRGKRSLTRRARRAS